MTVRQPADSLKRRRINPSALTVFYSDGDAFHMLPGPDFKSFARRRIFLTVIA